VVGRAFVANGRRNHDEVTQCQLAVQRPGAAAHHERTATHGDGLLEEAAGQGRANPGAEHGETLPVVLDLEQRMWAVFPAIL
jgi:hypothetical protein